MASFISASALSTLSGIVSLSFGFLCSIAVARLLGAEGSGSIAFALWLGTTITLVANFGVPHILNRYMPTYDKPDNPGGGLTRLLIPNFSIPVALTTIGFAGYAYWQHSAGGSFTYSSETWAMIAIFFLVFSIASVAEGSARGLNRFGETSRLVFIGCLLQLPFVLLGAYFFGIPGALAGYVVRYIPQALKLVDYIRHIPEKDAEVEPRMRAHGRNEWFSDVMGLLIWGRIEILFLGLYYSTTEIGYYAAGLTLSSLVVQLPTQTVAALTPHMGRHHDNNDVFRINQTYQRVTRWIAMMMLPVCFGGAAVIPVLLPLLFGQEFTDAVPMAVIIVASALATALGLVPSLTISARERSSFFLYSTPILAVISVAILAFVVPNWGGVGAAWTRATIHSLWFIWLVVYCWKHLNVRLDLVSLGKLILAGLACAAAAHFVLTLSPDFIGLVLAVAAGAITYLAAIRILHCIPVEDIYALEASLPGLVPERVLDFSISALLLLVPRKKQDNQ